MAWPNPPYPFANATSPEPMSSLDTMFNQAAAMMAIPCVALGTNAIALTPLANCPALSAYAELGGYRTRAVATSTGPVSVQYNGLGFLNAYHADGVTQASTGDVIIGQEYVFRFSQALNGGVGGFFLESPAVPNAPTTWFTPGGRLTYISGQPVMFTNTAAAQNVYYAPYIHPFVPIYNGANVQMYNFTSGLSDQVGLTLALAGSANWPGANNFDVFAILNPTPALATVQWTNQSTRATTLAVFGGFLTNSGTVTMRTGAATTVSVPANQGTFLGTFATGVTTFGGTNGQSAYVFGAAASGGVAAQFFLCNYYNKILQNTIVTDNGASYTYTTATIREARNSTTNSIFFVQSDSERTCLMNYNAAVTTTAAAGASVQCGIGINSTTAFSARSIYQTSGVALNSEFSTPYQFSITGVVGVTALEFGDGTNANTFNAQSANQLSGAIWL